MARCDVCDNDYDKAFEIKMGGQRFTFDSFECAIHRPAPICSYCGCKASPSGSSTTQRKGSGFSTRQMYGVLGQVAMPRSTHTIEYEAGVS